MAITLYCFDEDETIRLLYKVNDCTGPNRLATVARYHLAKGQ